MDKQALGSKKPARVIFPRYHQWAAVLRLEEAARTERAGHSYLVQHSAGSGKSNTIAWRPPAVHLARRQREGLRQGHRDHRPGGSRRQLQDTIYQFEHAHGLVQRIDTDSAQLAQALSWRRRSAASRPG